MGTRRRVRRLMADGAVYGWCFGHRHDRVRGHPGCGVIPGCGSTVPLWRLEGGACLRLVFRPGPDRVVADGNFDEGAAIRLPDRES